MAKKKSGKPNFDFPSKPLASSSFARLVIDFGQKIADTNFAHFCIMYKYPILFNTVNNQSFISNSLSSSMVKANNKKSITSFGKFR